MNKLKYIFSSYLTSLFSFEEIIFQYCQIIEIRFSSVLKNIYILENGTKITAGKEIFYKQFFIIRSLHRDSFRAFSQSLS